MSDHDVSGEGYSLGMRLYALEFENPDAAVKHIKQLKETIILNRKRFMALMQ